MNPAEEYLPTIPPQPPRRMVRPSLAGIVAGLLVLAVLLPLAPWSSPQSGDANGELYMAVRRAVEPGARHHLGIAEIADGRVRFAGSDPDREFEIGSISKTFTAALFADAIERGEVREDTTLGEVFPDAQLRGPIAGVTLADLSSHRSGLPRLSPRPGPLRAIGSQLTRSDPYDQSAEELLSDLPGIRLKDPGTVQYSNFGVALLGMALEEVTGTGYAELLRLRLFEPLGMADSYAPITPDGLRPGAPSGNSAALLDADPWTLGASAPAGGVRSTPRDLATFVRAVMEGSAPGADAARPRFPDDEGEGRRTEIGFGWFTVTEDERPLTYHNGSTGGFSSIVGFRPGEGRALLVLSDVALSVDGALGLLERD